MKHFGGFFEPVSGELLSLAIYGTGEKVNLDKDTQTYKAVEQDVYLNEKIKEALSSANGTIDTTIDLSFYESSNRDLGYGIGLATAIVKGEKKNGNWDIIVTVYDTYDFNDWDYEDSFKAWLNNAGVAAQYYGIVVPYEFEINIHMEIED